MIMARNIVLAACVLGTPSIASAGPFDDPGPLPYRDGQSVYRAICQSCHMADGKGAQGAGMYPALAGNPKLVAATDPVHVALNGKNGMPSFKRFLNDEQIAAVVNYVRTNFGNRYTDSVSVDDVKKMSGR